jgi:hypothetical protein
VRVGALLLALVVGAPSLAHAWVPLDQCSGQPTAWPPGVNETRWSLSSVFQSTELSTTDLDSAIGAAFAEWSQPGCSGFGAQQLSDIAGDPLDGTNSENIIGFYETSWPAQFGASTLAITLPVWMTDDCALIQSDMVFNGVDHLWVRGAPDSLSDEADVEAVAVHEVGHWIGFDHNSFPGSSLNAIYSNGLDERTLTCDDTAGVCELYSTAGWSCSDDIYCPCSRTCVDGTCQIDGGDDDDAVDPGDDDDAGDDDAGGDDDDAASGTDCGNGTLDFIESEPNDDTNGQTNAIAASGPDLRITGTTTCANDGEFHTGDLDVFEIAGACQERARLTLTWEEASDLDFVIWDAFGSLVLTSYEQSYEGPESAEAFLQPRSFVQVACWRGEYTPWTLTVDWPPYDAVDDGPRDVVGNLGSSARARSRQVRRAERPLWWVCCCCSVGADAWRSESGVIHRAGSRAVGRSRCERANDTRAVSTPPVTPQLRGMWGQQPPTGGGLRGGSTGR